MMNWNDMGYVTVVVCIVIVVLVTIKELTTKEPEPVITFNFDTPKCNKKKKNSVRAQSDPIKKSAKNVLISFGYTATEAKKMLQPLSCGTVDQYVNQAMKKVKI